MADLNSMGTISIIVPVYKVEKELDRCVQSLLNQTYKDIDVILVDDGSPDDCPKMCDRYASTDDRVCVIHKENGGLSDARNAGLRAAEGKYVLYVDSDDYIAQDACEKLVSAMQDEVDIVVGACREIHDDYETYQKHTNLIEGKIYSAKEYIISSIQRNEWYAPAWLNLYSRDYLVQNEMYYKVGYYFEDMQLLPKMFLSASNIKYVDYAFYNYIIREGSIMGSANSEKKVSDSLTIYTEWMETIESVEDKELQSYLYGILIRYYLKNARVRKIKGWKIQGMGFSFAMKYALGIKEKLKVLAFSIMPSVYVR